jgi:hypothetical protein
LNKKQEKDFERQKKKEEKEREKLEKQKQRDEAKSERERKKQEEKVMQTRRPVILDFSRTKRIREAPVVTSALVSSFVEISTIEANHFVDLGRIKLDSPPTNTGPHGSQYYGLTPQSPPLISHSRV